MEKFHIDLDGEPTPEQVIFNCNLAEKLWRERVKPAQVNLYIWVVTSDDSVCGTIACFGGHIGKWPEFLALEGAYTYPDGMPDLRSTRDAEFALFGNHWIFNSRSALEYNHEHDDYEIVLQRIARCRGMAEKGVLGERV